MCMTLLILGYNSPTRFYGVPMHPEIRIHLLDILDMDSMAAMTVFKMAARFYTYCHISASSRDMLAKLESIPMFLIMPKPIFSLS